MQHGGSWAWCRGLGSLLLLGLILGGCASANRARFVELDVTASTRAEALQAASRALGQHFEGVRLDEAGGVVTADPLLVDFGETPLDTLGTLAGEPLEVTQAMGSIRRTPVILVVPKDGGYGFRVQVEREVEELEASYVPYEEPYDMYEPSSMPINPGAGNSAAPARPVWVPQGNDLDYQERIRRSLAQELR
jgi:hypothetical protein